MSRFTASDCLELHRADLNRVGVEAQVGEHCRLMDARRVLSVPPAPALGPQFERVIVECNKLSAESLYYTGFHA
jgi:hypothetical protein